MIFFRAKNIYYNSMCFMIFCACSLGCFHMLMFLHKLMEEHKQLSLAKLVNLANTALREGKIKVSWVFSRMRKKDTVKQCYKCFVFSHHATNCNGSDRSKLCRKVCRKGHITENSTAVEIHRFLCRGKKRTKH